ncbi:MAG: prephenate dehydrogenase [Bacteroidales bacterium]
MSKRVCIVGMGLIGSSLAMALKSSGYASHIISVDKNEEHSQTAIKMGLATESASLEEGVKKAELILLCTPVDVICNLLPLLLDTLEEMQKEGIAEKIVADMGSTKWNIVKSVRGHSMRKSYVAVHPIAGTEHSGPQAAVLGLFKDKNAIICDGQESHSSAKNEIWEMLETIGMTVSEMDSYSHDLHVAYVSHISHITSFSLALSVLEKEKSEQNILTLAASGFESTVRLAKSNAQTWAPIFLQNREFIAEVIDSQIEKMALFKKYIEQNNSAALIEMMESANAIAKILK